MAEIGSGVQMAENGTAAAVRGIGSKEVLTKFSGFVRSFTRAEFDKLVSDERARISANSAGIYNNGEMLGRIIGEFGERSWTLGTGGGSDAANAASSHARNVSYQGKLYPLVADANVFGPTSGVPVSTAGINGDVAVDSVAGLIYSKASGAWSTGVSLATGTTPTSISALPLVALVAGTESIPADDGSATGARMTPAQIAAYTLLRVPPLAYGAGPATDLDFINAFTSSLAVLTVARASPATYFDASGAMQTAANNVARLDYDPVTLTKRGLLVEAESRANVLLNSATLATQTVTVTAVPYTLSFYGTGTVALSGASTQTLTGTGALPVRSTLTFTPAAGPLTLTVTGTVQYAQLEAGSFATSYIPTTGAAATRAADAITFTLPAAVKAAFGSSFACSFMPVGLVSSPRVIGSISGATGYGNQMQLTGSTQKLSVYDGGTNPPNTTNTLVAGYNKGVSSWNGGAGTFGVGLNGVAPSITTALTGYAGLTTVGLGFGGAGANAGNQFCAWYARLSFWSRFLTPVEMQQASA